MRASQLRSLSLSAAAKMIRTGRLSPVELTRDLIDQIHRTEPIVRAYTTICKEEAIREAEKAELRIKRRGANGSVDGIAVTLKDLIMTKGIRTTAGSKILSNYIPNIDATVVTRLKASGAFVLGKANTHEFGLGVTSPPTRNPWNASLSPGGSSGGSAAAIACGSAIASVGTDTGCSIRHPASLCGVVGLKATYGRVSRFGVYPASWSLDHVGPICKTVEDTAMMLGVMAGVDVNDPTTADIAVTDFRRSMRRSIRGLKIGIPKNHFFEHIDDGVAACVSNAIAKLRELGAVVVPFSFPAVDDIMASVLTIDSCESSSIHENSFSSRRHLYDPGSLHGLERGFLVPAVDYINAQRSRVPLTRLVLKSFAKFDVMISPTLPVVAQGVDAAKITYDDGFEEPLIFAMMRFAVLFNFTGLPAITLPCGFSSSLPVGLQIVGKLFDEETIIRVAYAYEAATDWGRTVPPICRN